MRARQFRHTQKPEVAISRELLCNGSMSGVAGGILGIIISFIVNITLVEISVSHFFAMYFGVLFVSVGLVVLWRISSQPQTEELRPRRRQLIFFAMLVVFSGIMCFMLRRDWFVGLYPIFKIPVYTILGTSVSFALAFSLVDLVNYAVGLLQASMARAVVESEAQVRLILIVALVMGGIFGCIFGMMDIEDSISYHVQLDLLREQRYCYPIGAILGAAAGFGNEYLKHQEDEYIKLQRTEFDEEI